MRLRPHFLAAAVVALALVASACGSGSDTNVANPAPSEEGTGNAPAAEEGNAEASAADTAAANLDNLAANDDVRLIEVLDVDTGEVATLSDTVDGDRPVLLWFWAPH